ncbi:MAG: SagB/ThcOx family dehydrogenase [Gammaproteobacteria bacterium]|nr:SagB/ThcOx family dehydrogenase [Gammaproteobacteria bacterium]
MNTKRFVTILLLGLLLLPQTLLAAAVVQLPHPKNSTSISLNQAIQNRRSVRNFTDQNLTVAQISQLLWAAQGITDPERGLRSAPSAGALYPLELYVVKKDGVWRYAVNKHALTLQAKGDRRAKLAQAALNQKSIKTCALAVVITANYQKSTKKYHKRGITYTHIEAGHAAQNLLLEVTALGLGAVPIGAFYDNQVAKILALPQSETPLYILAVGYAIPNYSS